MVGDRPRALGWYELPRIARPGWYAFRSFGRLRVLKKNRIFRFSAPTLRIAEYSDLDLVPFRPNLNRVGIARHTMTSDIAITITITITAASSWQTVPSALRATTHTWLFTAGK
jgi:hypothetical protein